MTDAQRRHDDYEDEDAPARDPRLDDPDYDPDAPQDCDLDDDPDGTPTDECPHCGAEIAAFAQQCPKCGEYTTPGGEGEATKHTPLGVVIVLVIAAIFVAWLMFR